MTDKSTQKIEQSDAPDVIKINAESSTPTYHIKDGPIEKFTKVSLFHYFNLKKKPPNVFQLMFMHVSHFILSRMAWH